MLRFDFPSPPPSRHLVAALEELFALGAVGDGVKLTDPLGQRMAELPLAPSLAKMLLVAGEEMDGDGVSVMPSRPQLGLK